MYFLLWRDMYVCMYVYVYAHVYIILLGAAAAAAAAVLFKPADFALRLL